MEQWRGPALSDSESSRPSRRGTAQPACDFLVSAVQKLFSVMWFHLFIFTFVAFAFGVKSQISLLRLTSVGLVQDGSNLSLN